MAGKKYKAAFATIDRDKFYGIEDAVKLIKAGAKAKFDETIESAAW
jgi:large subunit ribosomal protein L1